MRVQLKALDEYGQIIEGKVLTEDSPLYKILEKELNEKTYKKYQQIIITR